MDAATRDKPEQTPAETARGVRPVAVIDVGTSSIRMAIAEISPTGEIRTLEKLSQAVPLGKDTFTSGSIEKGTMEQCVEVLKSYRRVLQEYQIEREDQIRAVATSAVREAVNKLAFLDRVYIATGIHIEPIDEAEVNRITYLGIEPFLQSETTLATGNTVVIEVGGGSTEVLLVQNGNVSYAHTYRLGSLRMRETLQAFRAPSVKVRAIMESQIERTIEQIVDHIPQDAPPDLIALGGDVRFAASQILPKWNPDKLGRLRVSALETFTNKMLNLSTDKLVQKHHLSFTDAETLGPALLANVMLAQAMKLDQIYVTNVNLRDGLLKEMASRGVWTESFANQIIRSAVDLGRKFNFDEQHCLHVAHLCRVLFRELQPEHRLEPRYELILYIAAVLHEIGLFISVASHHKHTMYLINHSELFGLTKKDVQLVALVARYHRRASPKPTHPGYATLDRESRVVVSKMAAILRVADSLERSHSQRINNVHCKREDGRLVISVPQVDDLSLEQLALKQKGALFEETFGLKVLLRQERK